MKLGVQGQGSARILDIAGQERWGFWKLDSFLGYHMCIVPCLLHFEGRKVYIDRLRRNMLSIFWQNWVFLLIYFFGFESMDENVT